VVEVRHGQHDATARPQHRMAVPFLAAVIVVQPAFAHALALTERTITDRPRDRGPVLWVAWAVRWRDRHDYNLGQRSAFLSDTPATMSISDKSVGPVNATASQP
jgi:hypothetical protein